ncbi:hypothetical protein SAMN04487782_1774 [Stenotrophomonas maltophilia]|jgi:hypothetical protein|nr:hypothetical protein SAMN04487782_1774 [Stenotrophomonas maltophilia]
MRQFDDRFWYANPLFVNFANSVCAAKAALD